MLVAVDSWCSMCPCCPRAMLGGSNGVENARRIDRLRAESGRACAFWGVVEKKCSHENANNILFAWRIVLEGASDASTLPMWRVE